MTIATTSDLAAANKILLNLQQIEQAIALITADPSPTVMIALPGFNQIAPLSLTSSVAISFLQQLQASAIAALATYGVTAT
jgi:hypothetical protein